MTKTGDEKWMVDASANGIILYAMNIVVNEIVPEIALMARSIRCPGTPKNGFRLRMVTEP